MSSIPGPLPQEVTFCGWIQPDGLSGPQLGLEGRGSLSCRKSPSRQGPSRWVSSWGQQQKALFQGLPSPLASILRVSGNWVFLGMLGDGWAWPLEGPPTSTWSGPTGATRERLPGPVACLAHWPWSKHSAWAPASMLPAAMATGACARLGARATLMLVA